MITVYGDSPETLSQDEKVPEKSVALRLLSKRETGAVLMLWQLEKVWPKLLTFGQLSNNPSGILLKPEHVSNVDLKEVIFELFAKSFAGIARRLLQLWNKYDAFSISGHPANISSGIEANDEHRLKQPLKSSTLLQVANRLSGIEANDEHILGTVGKC